MLTTSAMNRFLLVIVILNLSAPYASASLDQWCRRLFSAGAVLTKRMIKGLHKTFADSAHLSKIESPRAQVIKNKLEEIELSDTKNIEKVVSIFQSCEFLPEGGIVHVYGPAQNFFEWVIPLLVRPDCKIIVSETKWKPSALAIGTTIEGEYETVLNHVKTDAENVYRQIQESNPEIFLFSSNVKNPSDLQLAINERVTLIEGGPDVIPLGDKPVADFAMIIGPFGYFLSTENLKMGGIVWIAREFGNDHGIVNPSDFTALQFQNRLLGAFLPSPTWHLENGLFLSHSSSDGGSLPIRTH